MALTPNDLNQLGAAMNDPETLDTLLAQLKSLGADEIGSGPPLNIKDFYREKPGKFDLQWPLNPSLSLPVPFDELDRKTQFFVLFGEWTRREFEGMMALNSGELGRAEEIFQECLQRAGQI